MPAAEGTSSSSRAQGQSWRYGSAILLKRSCGSQPPLTWVGHGGVWGGCAARAQAVAAAAAAGQAGPGRLRSRGGDDAAAAAHCFWLLLLLRHFTGSVLHRIQGHAGEPVSARSCHQHQICCWAAPRRARDRPRGQPTPVAHPTPVASKRINARWCEAPWCTKHASLHHSPGPCAPSGCRSPGWNCAAGSQSRSLICCCYS